MKGYYHFSALTYVVLLRSEVKRKVDFANFSETEVLKETLFQYQHVNASINNPKTVFVFCNTKD